MVVCCQHPRLPNLFSGPDPPRVAAWFGAWFFSLLASGVALGLRGTGQVDTNYFSVFDIVPIGRKPPRGDA